MSFSLSFPTSKTCRFSLCLSIKIDLNPSRFTKQAVRLEMIAKSDARLYRAYLIKEKLRLIFRIKDVDEAEKELIVWGSWTRRCRIQEFVELQLTTR